MISDEDTWAEFYASGYYNDDGEPRLFPEFPDCFGKYDSNLAECQECDVLIGCRGVAGGAKNESMR